jgi:hypothetical protein
MRGGTADSTSFRSAMPSPASTRVEEIPHLLDVTVLEPDGDLVL